METRRALAYGMVVVLALIILAALWHLVKILFFVAVIVLAAICIPRVLAWGRRR